MTPPRSVLRVCASLNYITEIGKDAIIVFDLTDDRVPRHSGKFPVIHLRVKKEAVPLWKELHTGDDMILELKSVRQE